MSDLAQIIKDLDESANELQCYMAENGIERGTIIDSAWLNVETAILQIRKVADNIKDTAE